MQMQILKGLEQGSDLWKEIRGKYLVASEAPIMMGASPNMSREELLNAKTSGAEQEITRWMEIIFGQGHEAEALARPIAEERLADDLHALVGVREVAGLRLLASFDGLTLPTYDMHWECKQRNAELWAIVEAKGELTAKHYWQLEHQLAVNGNSSCIFGVYDLETGAYVEMEYHSRPERREQLIEGWKVFLKDMESYQHEAAPVKPAGETIRDLPALVVEITGGVKSSNLIAYRQTALTFIENINSDLQTDEDFATAENVVKFLEGKEKELVIVERQIIGQVASIDEITRTIAELKTSMRNKRLVLDKLIKSEKENRRAEIVQKVKNTWAIYTQEINDLLRPVSLPQIPVDFANAIKGKRTIESLRSAANAELTRARIEANRWQNHITANLQLLDEIAKDHKFLFNDMQQMVLKDKDALEAIAKQRIAEHKAAEDRRIQAEVDRIAAEKEKQRIAAEESKRAEEKRQEELRLQQEAEKRKAEESASTYAAPFVCTDCGWTGHSPNTAGTSLTEGLPSCPECDSMGVECPGATIPISVAPRSGLVRQNSNDRYENLYANSVPSAELAPAPPPAGSMVIRPAYGARQQRPTDRAIITVLAREFRVSSLDVIKWLKEIDLDGEIELIAAQA